MDRVLVDRDDLLVLQDAEHLLADGGELIVTDSVGELEPLMTNGEAYVGAYEQRSPDKGPCSEVGLCFVVREVSISDFELSRR